MNCQTFKTIATELAREQVVDVESREDALAHARACVGCQDYLEEERALTRGLRVLAAATEFESAPLAVEDRLVSAFRVMNQPAFVQRSARRFGRRLVWGLAAAAMMLVVFGLSASRFWRADEQPSRGDRQAGVAGNEPPPPMTPTQSPVNPDAVEAGLDDVRREREVAIGRPPKSRPPSSAVKLPKSVANRLLQEESTTDFIPVSFSQTLPPLEGGKIIRVEIPRSMLASFGIPLNADRSGGRVKADVLVGDDGLARAIRFVNPKP